MLSSDQLCRHDPGAKSTKKHKCKEEITDSLDWQMSKSHLSRRAFGPPPCVFRSYIFVVCCYGDLIVCSWTLVTACVQWGSHAYFAAEANWHAAPCNHNTFHLWTFSAYFFPVQFWKLFCAHVSVAEQTAAIISSQKVTGYVFCHTEWCPVLNYSPILRLNEMLVFQPLSISVCWLLACSFITSEL